MNQAQREQAEATAGKLAQLLAETLIQATPHTAKVHHEEHFRQVEDFLEGLETHTAAKIGPFLQELFDGVEVPEPLRPIVADAVGPQAQFSAIVTQLFLYGIVSQLLGTSVQPYLQGVSNDLWTKAVASGISVPVSPAVIATAAARGLNFGDDPTVKMPDWAYTEAAKSGTSKEDIDLQASIVGTPPSPQELFELLRRGIIKEPRLKQGMAEGDTRDDWIDELSQLAHGWLTPLDFVRAAVQSQMSYGDAQEWAKKTGLDTETALPISAGQVGGSDDMFGLAWAIAGRPPGPVELANMALRKIIPRDGKGAGETTFEQGIAESDVKTKWTEALWKLAQYVPPPNEIGTLLERGGINHDQAVTLWEERGVPTELAHAYSYITEQQHVTQDKLLAKGTVLTAYFDRLLTHPEAMDLLGSLGFRGHVAETMLSVQDFRREMTALNAVVRRVTTLYSQRKLSAVHAKDALLKAGLDAGEADAIMAHWDALREQPIHLPTAREIGLAMQYGTIDQQTALAELAELGYQPRDAAIVLSAHSKAKITPLPPAGTTVTG